MDVAGWLVRLVATHQDLMEQRDRAFKEWTEADRLAKELREALHAVQ